MREHDFTLILSARVGLENGAAIEALAEAGCTDATVSRTPDGVWIAEFTREAEVFSNALTSSIIDVRDAGLEVLRVEPDEYMTLSEVAAYIGRTVESVRLLNRGERGDGTFPLPSMHLTNRGKLWRRTLVAKWAGLPDAEIDKARWIAGVNATLQFRLFDTQADRDMLGEIRTVLDRPGLTD